MISYYNTIRQNITIISCHDVVLRHHIWHLIMISYWSNSGRKGTDSEKQNAKLMELVPFVKTPNIHVELLLQIASNHFDAARNANTALPVAAWKNALETTKKIIQILQTTPNVILSEVNFPDFSQNFPDPWQNFWEKWMKIRVTYWCTTTGRSDFTEQRQGR